MNGFGFLRASEFSTSKRKTGTLILKPASNAASTSWEVQVNKKSPDCYLSSFFKAEDPEAYKKLASEGSMLAYPITIQGRTHREDNDLPFHSTIKVFDNS